MFSLSQNLLDVNCWLVVTQHIFIGSLTENPSSSSNIFVQTNSINGYAIALYSTSALDLGTTLCFLLCQVTIYTLSTSWPSIICQTCPNEVCKTFYVWWFPFLCFPESSPLPFYLLKHLKILIAACQWGCSRIFINWLYGVSMYIYIWHCWLTTLLISVARQL